MITIFACVALLPIRYDFSNLPVQKIELKVTFDGFLPLMGGSESKVETTFGLDAKNEGKDKQGRDQASINLTSFSGSIDGAPVPFTVDNVRAYFPKTTVSYLPTGKVVASNAPNLILPIRLPGLDAKHLPELTIFPIEFPEEGVEIGKSFAFSKDIGDGKAEYVVTPTAVNGNTLNLKLEVKQDYENLEDEALQIPKNPKNAINKVQTALRGEGTAEFNTTLNRVTSLKINALATSKVTPLSTSGTASERKLKIEMILGAPAPVTKEQVVSAGPYRDGSLFQDLRAKAQFAWATVGKKAFAQIGNMFQVFLAMFGFPSGSQF